ncbi:hypothetical protein ACOME3_003734 [Neoechinorhynchus agilis]
MTSIEKVFIMPTVQRLLYRITGFDIKRVFQRCPGLDKSKVCLLTQDQYQKAIQTSMETVRKTVLQMPPVLDPIKCPSGIIETDPELENHSDIPYGFVDISDVDDRVSAIN